MLKKTWQKFDLATREDYVIEELKNWNSIITATDRVHKYGKMSQDPHSFYRGTNHLFWKDLIYLSDFQNYISPKTKTWIQGDMHAYNFGIFETSSKKLVFDLNDFDESLVFDYIYDLFRLTISIMLINIQLQMSSKKIFKVISSFLDAYVAEHEKGEKFHVEDTYLSVNSAFSDLKELLKNIKKKKSRKIMLSVWTERQKGKRLFNYDLPTISALSKDEYEKCLNSFLEYTKMLSGEITDRIEVKDIAGRLFAGTGSLGVKRYYILCGYSKKSSSNDFILDVKLQKKPAAYFAMTADDMKTYDESFLNEGIRHARAFMSMPKHTDDFIGWMKMDKSFFSVRERSPFKESYPVEELASKKEFSELAANWGSILAVNHSRSYNEFNSNYVVELLLNDFNGFKEMLFEISNDYSTIVKKDFNYFMNALERDII